MDDERIVVALVALTALLAFGVGAANLADAVDSELSPEVSESADRDVSPPADVPAPSDTCLLGCQGIGGLLSGLLAGASTTQLLAVGGLLVGAVAALWWLTRGRPGGDEGASDPTPTVAAPDDGGARVPTTAPADPPATNEVYRAWLDLADAIDAERQLTPAEYAARARERGYDADAVETLTAVFRRVRYGDGTATGDREQRAREAIEAITEGAQ